MADKQSTTERVGNSAKDTLAKSPSEQRDDSTVDQAPEGEVLTTAEAVTKIERNSDPDGPSPRSY